MISSLELIRDQLRAVGIPIEIKAEDGGLFGTRISANEHDAAADLGHNGLAIILEPTDYLPSNMNSRYAPLWVYWFLDSESEQAEEPPAPTKKQIELFHRARATVDAAEQDALMNQILDIAIDQFYAMGIALRKREYGIVSNPLRNTPDLSIAGFHHADFMPTNPQQYFFAAE